MNSLDMLEMIKEANGGHWGEHPEWTVAEWARSAAEGETRLGYWQWVMDLEQIKRETEQSVR